MTLLALASVFAAPTAAQADGTAYPVAWTHEGIFTRTTPTMAITARTENAIPDGTMVSIRCETTAEVVNSDAGSSDIWEQLTDGTYLPNAFVDTGTSGFTPGVPRCDAAAAAPEMSADKWNSAQIAPTVGYVPQAAMEWALGNVDSFEVKYTSNCTWFASNALWAGGLAKDSNWTDATFDPFKAANWWSIGGPSNAATTAKLLMKELVDTGVATSTPIDIRRSVVAGAKIGDLIFFDWDPNGTADGQVDHVDMITGFDGESPLLTGQSWPVKDNPWRETHDGKMVVDTVNSVQAYLVHIVA